jgi:hypothetical protein
MGWCSGTGEFDAGLGCEHEPQYCSECHNELVRRAVASEYERSTKSWKREIEKARKEATLMAVEFANWYGRKINRLGGDFKGDAVFFYDEWKKEKASEKH